MPEAVLACPGQNGRRGATPADTLPRLCYISRRCQSPTTGLFFSFLCAGISMLQCSSAVSWTFKSLGEHGLLQQSSFLRNSHQQVQVLDGLPGSALHQVVDHCAATIQHHRTSNPGLKSALMTLLCCTRTTPIVRQKLRRAYLRLLWHDQRCGLGRRQSGCSWTPSRAECAGCRLLEEHARKSHPQTASACRHEI